MDDQMRNTLISTASTDTADLLSPPAAARELARLWGRPSLSVDSIYLYMRDKGLQMVELQPMGGRKRYGIAPGARAVRPSLPQTPSRQAAAVMSVWGSRVVARLLHDGLRHCCAMAYAMACATVTSLSRDCCATMLQHPTPDRSRMRRARRPLLLLPVSSPPRRPAIQSLLASPSPIRRSPPRCAARSDAMQRSALRCSAPR